MRPTTKAPKTKVAKSANEGHKKPQNKGMETKAALKKQTQKAKTKGRTQKQAQEKAK